MRKSVFRSLRANQSSKRHTVMIQNFQTDQAWQTVQMQIRLPLEEQSESDQGLHCLLLHLHLSDEIP